MSGPINSAEQLAITSLEKLEAIVSNSQGKCETTKKAIYSLIEKIADDSFKNFNTHYIFKKSRDEEITRVNMNQIFSNESSKAVLSKAHQYLQPILRENLPRYAETLRLQPRIQHKVFELQAIKKHCLEI